MKIFVVLSLLLIFQACNKTSSSSSSATEDSSVGGVVAGSIGGSLNTSSSSGNLAIYKFNKSNFLQNFILNSAQASSTCPTILTANGSGCANQGTAVDLTYAGCSFHNTNISWTGMQEISLSSGGSISCGTFPDVTALTNGQSINRQFVSSYGTPGSMQRAYGSVTQHIDHSSTNLSNFDNQTISANIGTGYGSKIIFDGSGKRKSLNIKQRVYLSNGYDHTIVGTVNVLETTVSSVQNREVSGTITVYHNKMKVVGTSTITSLEYQDSSCTPISGKIVTAYSAGSNVSPSTAGSALVGKSETLVFNSDGTATLTDTDGTTSTVSVAKHCY